MHNINLDNNGFNSGPLCEIGASRVSLSFQFILCFNITKQIYNSLNCHKLIAKMNLSEPEAELVLYVIADDILKSIKVNKTCRHPL